MSYDPMFYDMAGNQISRDEWAELFELPNRIVIQETVAGPEGKLYWISTVWLGMDHAWGQGHLPMIFETMVFVGEHGSGSDIYQHRYSSLESAKEGHREVVEMIELGVLKGDDDDL